MKKIFAILAFALLPFASQARELTDRQEQEMFVFCDLVSLTAGQAAKSRDQGISLEEYLIILDQGIKQMKQTYIWTTTKRQSLDNVAKMVYKDIRMARFTPNQTKRWTDAACIAEAYK